MYKTIKMSNGIGWESDAVCNINRVLELFVDEFEVVREE